MLRNRAADPWGEEQGLSWLCGGSATSRKRVGSVPGGGIGAPSDVPAVDLAVAQLDGRRGPGYANRLQHADDLGPPSHNLTVRLHPVQVRMQQRLERAPITLDDRGMRA